MLIFFSDPHLGVDRRANTTPASRRALQQACLRPFGHVQRMVKNFRDATKTPTATVCLGDLFDSFSNKERTIVDAATAYERSVDYCLAGNHDLINDTTKESSLGVIREMFPGTVVQAGVGESKYECLQFDQMSPPVNLWMVPHHSSQGLFEDTLQEIIHRLPEMKGRQEAHGEEAYTDILCVHCNYGLPEEHVANDVTLNLTEEDVEYLLESGFDYILFGHEHKPREKFKGRVRILGNTQPTSFSDISDKYITTFDGKEWDKILIWNAKNRSMELHIDLDWPDIGPEVEFIDVVGETEPEGVSAVVKRIQALWEDNPHVFCIRNNVKVNQIVDLVNADHPELSASTIEQIVSAHLKNTDLFDLWVELTREVGEEAC